MKNIVYIGTYDGIVGGIERYMQKSAELLRRNGLTVHYRHTGHGGRDREGFAAAFDSVAEFAAGDDALLKAELVMLHNIVPVEVLKKLPSEKTIFFAHDHNIYCRRHHYYTPLGRTNCQRSAGKLRCFLCSLGRNPAPPLVAYRALPAVVLSDFMGDNLRRNGFQRVVKLPAFIQTHAKPRSFMPDGVMRILFLGQLIRGKGADLMLKCLAGLDFPFSCTIAGDGNDRKMLEEMVRKLGLQQRVHFAGFVSAPESLWDKCDVFFFPIRWQEPFGLVGLEAMAHGVPVVAHDLGGVREWLEDGKNGFAIPAGKDAKTALELMFRNPEQLLEKMSSAAMKMAGEKFSGEKFVEEFKKLPEVLQ